MINAKVNQYYTKIPRLYSDYARTRALGCFRMMTTQHRPTTMRGTSVKKFFFTAILGHIKTHDSRRRKGVILRKDGVLHDQQFVSDHSQRNIQSRRCAMVQSWPQVHGSAFYYIYTSYNGVVKSGRERSPRGDFCKYIVPTYRLLRNASKDPVTAKRTLKISEAYITFYV